MVINRMNIPVTMGAIAAISPLDSFLNIFNTNPYFIGIMMLLMNLGGRFLALEITKEQEKFLQQPWVRRSLIFIVLFIATRNVWVSFWATIVIILFLGYLFNENSALCVFGKGGTADATCNKPTENEMTSEEKMILQQLMAKSQRSRVPPADAEDDVLHTDIYAANMYLLKR